MVEKPIKVLIRTSDTETLKPEKTVVGVFDDVDDKLNLYISKLEKLETLEHLGYKYHIVEQPRHSKMGILR